MKKTNRYFKTTKSSETTLENIPEFLPSDHEDSDEEEEDDKVEGGVPTYVPRHLPAFPSKHSFRQTPVSTEYYIPSLIFILTTSLDLYNTT